MANKWVVTLSRQAVKQAKRLDKRVAGSFSILLAALSEYGPAPGKNWPNYGKLVGSKSEDKRHCHLLRGRPTYVCCWSVSKTQRLIEVYYVGTHEKAPY